MAAPKKENESNQGRRLAILGAGPGGYPAAFIGASLGLDVTLIDPRPEPGGVCLYEGCIPSKTLLHVARFLEESRSAEAWGIHVGKPRIDIDKLRERSGKVVAKLTGGLAALCSQRHVRYVRGRGRFADNHTVVVTDPDGDGKQERIEFDHAIVATGSRASSLPGFDADRAAVWDSTDALRLEDVPQTLLVVGGGYIGLELATIYHALGSRVTVVEMTESLLPGVDPDLVEPLRNRLQADGGVGFDAILLRTRVTAMEPYQHGVLVTLQDADGTTARRKFNRVLVAVGRRPCTDGLGLENTGVIVNESGFIEVDHEQRTAERHIFAVGDVAGEPMLAHKASYEGRVAAEAAAGRPAASDAAAVPAVVFTDPEVAWAGLTETEARRRGLDVHVVRFPWAASGRAATLGRNDGLTKLIVENRTERILGLGITGTGAGELIAEGVLAIETGTRARDLMLTIHPHPTLSETVMETADVFFGQSAHFMPRSGGGE